MDWVKKVWRFLWKDNSIWSFLANVLLAFILIKFIVYPGLGLLLGTPLPVVAVISGSMEQGVSMIDGTLMMCGNTYDERFRVDFDRFWGECGAFYEDEYGITKQEFRTFPFSGGFNKGDIMMLVGVKNVRVGDVVVFAAGQREPIIHRVVAIREEEGGKVFETKGDHNAAPIYLVRQERSGFVMVDRVVLDERNVPQDALIGKAAVRIPYVGYLKIGFEGLIGLLR